MPDPEPSANHGSSLLVRDPSKLTLIDLFALLTLAALLSAMAAPLIREMRPENRGRLLAVGGIQLAAAATAFARAARRRKRLLQMSGHKLGIAYCGELRWRHWPSVKSAGYMLLVVSAQLSVALAFAERIFSLFSAIYHLQLACIAGYAAARFLWRAYPNSVEFFANGVSLGGIHLVEWKHVELRPSQFFVDRVAVVLRQAGWGGVTKMAQIAPALRERVFAAAESAKGGSSWAALADAEP